MSVLVRAIALSMLVLFSSAFAFGVTVDPPKPPIKIMSYNLENLFDEFHDTDKNDLTFTPTGTEGKAAYCETIRNFWYKKECYVNWTTDRVNDKMDRLSRVIKNDTQSIPDILVTSEIENKSIAERLNSRLGFDDIAITTSPDRRGIDVAIFYKENENLSYVSQKDIVLDYARMEKETGLPSKPTRNILEVRFKLYEKYTLFVYAVHFPSQAAPASVRTAVARQLQDHLLKRRSQIRNAHYLLAGDFNTLPTDKPNAIEDVLQNTKFELNDVHTAFNNDKNIKVSIKNSIPFGTYFYARKMSWNMLDRFLVSDNLDVYKKRSCKTGLMLDAAEYRIQTSDFYTKTYTYSQPKETDVTRPHSGTNIKGVPAKFVVKPQAGVTEFGYSDHFPIIAEFKEMTRKPNSKHCPGDKKYFYSPRK